ncbi:hydroxysteroid 11-beta-dehydrogenase 1-like protein B [Bolinopsis microptera]|uniref:hydroxysteroid 11-beta-dehydrogenase 1-like protein B n=1 Tax=Bolinopsis microptera TaxID=2820187 RepID=UPI00307A3BA3
MESKVVFVLILALSVGLYWKLSPVSVSDSQYKSALKDKVVLLCHASSGVGEQLAYELARHGAKLLLVTRTGRSESLSNKLTLHHSYTDSDKANESAVAQLQISAQTFTLLQAVRDQALKLGSPQVEILSFDFGEVKSGHTLVDRAVESLGGLDFLILNQEEIARGYLVKGGRPIDHNFVQRTFSVNLLSSIEISLKAMPHLEKSKGHIFVASSALGEVPKSGLSVLSATKHALNGFFYSLQQELKEKKSAVTLTVGALGEIAAGDRMPLFTLPDWMVGEKEECAAGILHSLITRPTTFTYPSLHLNAARLAWFLG